MKLTHSNDSPLVSVIVPAYNRADTLSQTLDSVLEQSYRHFELIVVDDGSTDSTAESVRKYNDQIQYIFQDNAGPSAARNRGIAESQGRLVTFLDSDDLWLPTKLETQVRLMSQLDASVVCCLCNALMRQSDGREFASFDNAELEPSLDEGVWVNVTQVLATRFVFFNQAVMVRREALLETGGYDESLWLMEDQDLALRLALKGKWAFTNEPLVIWQGGAENSLCGMASKNPVLLHQSIEKIYQKLLDCQDETLPCIERYLLRSLNVARRNIQTFELLQNGSLGKSLVGKVVAKWGRLQDAIYRRLPGYPHMQVEPLP